MNFKTKLFIAFVVGYLGYTAYEIIHQYGELKKIRAKSEDERQALHTAHKIMTERIEAGLYHQVSVAKMLEDFEFYTIVNQNRST